VRFWPSPPPRRSEPAYARLEAAGSPP
jgi:hypothetical protein